MSSYAQLYVKRHCHRTISKSSYKDTKDPLIRFHDLGSLRYYRMNWCLLGLQGKIPFSTNTNGTISLRSIRIIIKSKLSIFLQWRTHFSSIEAKTGHARSSFPSDSRFALSSLSEIKLWKRLHRFSSLSTSSWLI